MNFRTTYILLGVVVACLVGLGIYVAVSGDKKTSPAVEGYVLQSLRAANITPDKVTALEIERPGQTPERIAFAQEGGRWQMVAPSKARTDSATVEAIVRALLNARIAKSADIAGSPAAHGLENPPVKVTLRAGELAETVSLGNVTVGGDKAVVYVTTSLQPDRPQAARRGDFAPLFKSDVQPADDAGQLVKGVPDFRPLKLIGEGLVDPAGQVVSFAVRTGKDEMALFRGPPTHTWRFRIPADYGEAAAAGPPPGGTRDPAAIDSVPELLNTIMSIQPASRAQIIENPGDLSKFGLDPATNAPLQIDFSRADGTKETLYVSSPVLVEGKEKYYARNEADQAVAEVPAEPVKKVLGVLANKTRLRDRTVLHVLPARVDAIDVAASGETFSLRKVGNAWRVYDADGKSHPARAAQVMELLTRLTSSQLATSFPPPGEPDNKVGFDPPVAELKIWEGGIVKEEKADPNAKPKVTAQPNVRALFGHKAQGDVVYLRRVVGDLKGDFFVPVDAYNLASRSHLDYIDGSITPLDSAAVTKLSFTHGKEQYTVERSDTSKPIAQADWKITSPERLQGRPADPGKVSGLVTALSLLHSNRVAADRVTADVLNRLEVNPESPRLKVTVAVKDQPDRVFLFGGDVGTEKRSVYLKTGQQDLVFEVDRGAFEQFQKADLVDTVVHRIDKAKLQAVKLTGWQEVLGTPTTLVIERHDGKWTLKAGGTFELDPAKVDALLNDLTTPRADAFVVYKDGPKAEYNLDLAKNALAIEMVLDMGEPVKMMVSPATPEGKVFATSSRSPGDVFVMPDRFAALRAKPAALKKD